MQRTVRDATPDDAEACAALYAPYVTGTAVSFETLPPSPAQVRDRIARAVETHAWLVLEQDDRVLGYAYGGAFAPRAAYRWACEVSVYLDQDCRRSGGGRALYAELLPRLAGRGYRTALAGMTLPNEGSVRLHTALGFVPAGTYRRVGYKLGAWHDVAWMQRDLRPEPAEPGVPAEPR